MLASRKEAAVKYSLAGMVVYIQATGGKVLRAAIEDGSHTLVEIEDSLPHLAMNCWGDSRQIDPMGLAEVLARANGIDAALVAVAHIGAEASGWWASTLAPGDNFADSLPDEDVGENWHDQMPLLFAESLGIDPESSFWRELVEEIYQESRKVVVANWFAVEYYCHQLDVRGEVFRFLDTSEDEGGFLIPCPLTDQKARAIWEDVEFRENLCARKPMKKTEEAIEY